MNMKNFPNLFPSTTIEDRTEANDQKNDERVKIWKYELHMAEAYSYFHIAAAIDTTLLQPALEAQHG